MAVSGVLDTPLVKVLHAYDLLIPVSRMNSDNQLLVHFSRIGLVHFSQTNQRQVEFLNKFPGNMSRFGIVALMFHLLSLFVRPHTLSLHPYFVFQNTNLIRDVFRTMSKIKRFAKTVTG